MRIIDEYPSETGKTMFDNDVYVNNLKRKAHVKMIVKVR
jgi:hypothetical protein